MRKFTIDEMARLSARRSNAFRAIADLLGKEHEVTKMMGSLAWGRHEFEGGPDARGIQFEAMRLAYLIGRFDTLNLWARDNAPNAQREMLKLWPTSFAVEREKA